MRPPSGAAFCDLARGATGRSRAGQEPEQGRGQRAASQADILRAAGSENTRLHPLFHSGGKAHQAWGKLIVTELPGHFSLPADPPLG
jgi:hypothetical protein